ncbi:MAG: DUF3368 domain-containing protein [Anaerolineae bacterium]
MPDRPVILNNTPLVALWSLDLLAILRQLYTEVVIPPTVYDEFLAVNHSVRQTALADNHWIKTIPLGNPRQALVYVGLDKGEAEVLALATELSARLVVMDERKGRRYAQRLGLPLTGTVGVLLAAKHNGFIPSLAPLLERLREKGLFLAPDLVNRALKLAQE